MRETQPSDAYVASHWERNAWVTLPPPLPPPLVRLIAVMSHEAVTGLNETVACGTGRSLP